MNAAGIVGMVTFAFENNNDLESAKKLKKYELKNELRITGGWGIKIAIYLKELSSNEEVVQFRRTNLH